SEGKGVGRGEGDDTGGRVAGSDPTARVKALEVYATRGTTIGGQRNIASVSGGQGEIVHRTRRGKDPGNLGRIHSRDQGSRVSDRPRDRDTVHRERITGEITKVAHRQGPRGTADCGLHPRTRSRSVNCCGYSPCTGRGIDGGEGIIGSLGRTYAHAIDRQIVRAQRCQRVRRRGTAHRACYSSLRRKRRLVIGLPSKQVATIHVAIAKSESLL